MIINTCTAIVWLIFIIIFIVFGTKGLLTNFPIIIYKWCWSPSLICFLQQQKNSWGQIEFMKSHVILTCHITNCKPISTVVLQKKNQYTKLSFKLFQYATGTNLSGVDINGIFCQLRLNQISKLAPKISCLLENLTLRNTNFSKLTFNEIILYHYKLGESRPDLHVFHLLFSS